MNQVLETNKDVMRSIRQSEGLFSKRPIPRKHVSYNVYEHHLQEIEESLMKKYRCGYSQLHKTLIKEKAKEMMNKNLWN